MSYKQFGLIMIFTIIVIICMVSIIYEPIHNSQYGYDITDIRPIAIVTFSIGIVVILLSDCFKYETKSKECKDNK